MNKKFIKILALILVFSFLFQQTGFAQAAAVELNIASHLSRMSSSFTVDKFRPIHLRYLQYLPQDNSFKLYLDKGDQFSQPVIASPALNPSPVIARSEATKQSLELESKKLLSYFYIGLTLPNDSFWVNLRPDNEDNIIDEYLSKTDVGRIMLEADLQLKKDTSLMTSPKTPEGREYWTRLYKKAEELYGYDNVTIPTLTRPWIVPGEIIIRETVQGLSPQGTVPEPSSAYIYKATLKVMLESDYLASVIASPAGAKQSPYEFKDSRSKALNEYSTELIKELIIPKLTKEVNSSKRYAPLRQVYYSLILAQWFKTRFKHPNPSLRGREAAEAISSRIDSRDLTNLISKEAWSKTIYFDQYKKSFTQGEYNIQEPVYTPTGQVIRSYFSGGENFSGIAGSPMTIIPTSAGSPLKEGILSTFVKKGFLLTLLATASCATIEPKIIQKEQQTISDIEASRLTVTSSNLSDIESVRKIKSTLEDWELNLLVSYGIKISESSKTGFAYAEHGRRFIRFWPGQLSELTALHEFCHILNLLIDYCEFDSSWVFAVIDAALEKSENIAILTKEAKMDINPPEYIIMPGGKKVAIYEYIKDILREMGKTEKEYQQAWKDLYLRNNHRFSYKWERLNVDKGVKYWRDLFFGLFRRDGFVSVRASGDAKEDIAETWRILRSEPEKLRELSNQDAGVKEKADMLTSTLAVFKSLMATEEGKKRFELIKKIKGNTSLFFDQEGTASNSLPPTQAFSPPFSAGSSPAQKDSSASPMQPERIIFSKDATSVPQFYDSNKIWVDNNVVRVSEEGRLYVRFKLEPKTGKVEFSTIDTSKAHQRVIYITFTDTALSSVFGTQFDSQKRKLEIRVTPDSIEQITKKHGPTKDTLKSGLSWEIVTAFSSLPDSAGSPVQKKTVSSAAEVDSADYSKDGKLEDVNQTIRDEVAQFNHNYNYRNRKIIYKEPPEQLWARQYDLNRSLHFVLLELLDNAGKFSKIGGVIEISLGRQNNSIILKIIDKGIGMSADELQSIGKLAWRGERAKKYAEGQGKGYWWSKETIEHSYRGSITIESQGEDMGVTVTISLPLANNREDSAKDLGPKVSSSIENDPAAGSALTVEQEAARAKALEIAGRINKIYQLWDESQKSRDFKQLISECRLFNIDLGKYQEKARKESKEMQELIKGVTWDPKNDLRNILVPISEYLSRYMEGRDSYEKVFSIIQGSFEKMHTISHQLQNIRKWVVVKDTLDLEQSTQPPLEHKEIGLQIPALQAPDQKSGSPIEKAGGIDFRALPIVTQAMSNLRINFGDSPLRGQSPKVNLTKEWQEIERMASSGITPSAERLKEYLQISYAQGKLPEDKDRIILCIANILRSEEETCCATDPTLRDILVVLEASFL